MCRLDLAFWMQTTGASLLAVNRCSPVPVRMAAQDSRSAHMLLYLAAVRAGISAKTVKTVLTLVVFCFTGP